MTVDGYKDATVTVSGATDLHLSGDSPLVNSSVNLTRRFGLAFSLMRCDRRQSVLRCCPAYVLEVSLLLMAECPFGSVWQRHGSYS